jgi:hypothetical protein
MYEITEEDLKFNKRGSISPGQKAWLGMSARRPQFFLEKCFYRSWVHVLGLCIVVALYLQNSVLSSASGTIRFDQDSSGESGITSDHVFVGKQKFTFGDEMSAVFKEGERYKVYYCKSGVYEFVLSLEQVSNKSSSH